MVLDIRAARKVSRIRQRDLAAATGISVRELMRLERGLISPSEKLLRQISNCLGMDVAQITIGQNQLFENPLTGEGYATARPQNNQIIPRRKPLDCTKKPVIDLFCGVGGLSYGFEMHEEFQVVAGVDLLSDRLQTFSRNHGTANAYGQDINTLSTDILYNENPHPFVIVGGPPCQGFSSIRPFRNIERNDPRNNLAEEFCRIVHNLQPEWIVFENVVGLLTHSNGKTFQTIVEAFEEIGYRTAAKVLNAAYYGLPQCRERLIIVGSRAGKPFKWTQPTHWCEHRSMAGRQEFILKPSKGLIQDLQSAITVDEAIHDLPEVEAGGRATTYQCDIESTPYELFIRNGAQQLKMHEATAHSPRMLEIIRQAGANIYALPEGVVKSGFSSCYSRLNGAEPSVTLTVNFVHPASNRCIHPHQHRALTPREGARLQGFLDTFEFIGTRSQIVKQIGNAVPPLLGRTVAQAILESD
ncbi:DNA (cytosine-5-)-methyltransferase [Calothrix sp. PCC 6303]|uniref:DNA (cytosine-5-)-methyltransferase n=1 Tax=Calothrix sp. PCC 6303 TaxID=1170562 RepID=UPI00130D6164|nr:DNA (cytosine-5-)-methyltransferase [Calothrix sp. PCC 6303]